MRAVYFASLLLLSKSAIRTVVRDVPLPVLLLPHTRSQPWRSSALTPAWHSLIKRVAVVRLALLLSWLVTDKCMGRAVTVAPAAQLQAVNTNTYHTCTHQAKGAGALLGRCV